MSTLITKRIEIRKVYRYDVDWTAYYSTFLYSDGRIETVFKIWRATIIRTEEHDGPHTVEGHMGTDGIIRFDKISKDLKLSGPKDAGLFSRVYTQSLKMNYRMISGS